jgi:hypothetical protein
VEVLHRGRLTLAILCAEDILLSDNNATGATMPAVFLKDRALIRVSGTEAQSFLQNLITTDIVSLASDEARPGALLTPQGKILFDFMIWRDGDDFVIETDEEQRDALLKRLTMYKLRAAVDACCRWRMALRFRGAMISRRFSGQPFRQGRHCPRAHAGVKKGRRSVRLR